MIVIWNWLFEKILKGYVGITIFPFIFIYEKYSHSKRLIRHEKEHLKQQICFLVLPFFVIYLVNYIINLIIYRNHDLAYEKIWFEKQARKAERG